MRSATKKKIGKDPEYLEWIRTLPCRCCWSGAYKLGFFQDFVPDDDSFQQSKTEPAHVGKRGLSQKCPDREAIPLCIEHHREGRYSAHRIGEIFWWHWGIDRDKLIRELNEAYEVQR